MVVMAMMVMVLSVLAVTFLMGRVLWVLFVDAETLGE